MARERGTPPSELRLVDYDRRSNREALTSKFFMGLAIVGIVGTAVRRFQRLSYSCRYALSIESHHAKTQLAQLGVTSRSRFELSTAYSYCANLAVNRVHSA